MFPLAGTDRYGKSTHLGDLLILFSFTLVAVLYFMCNPCLYLQVSNMSVEFRYFFDQRRGYQLEPDLSEEVSARLRLGSGSNGLLRRKVSIETKEKNCSGKERDRRTDDLLELTEVLFFVLILKRGMSLNNLSYSKLEYFVLRTFSRLEMNV